MSTRKSLLTALLAAATIMPLLGCAPAAAPRSQAGSWDGLGCLSKATFSYVAQSPLLDTSMSFRELKNLESAVGFQKVGQEQLGHYESALDTAVSYDFASSATDEAGASHACLTRLSFAPTLRPSIYLAREMPAGGCLASATELHERRHHEIQQARQREAIEIFAATKALPLPKISGRPEEAKTKFDAFIRKQADELNEFLQSYPQADQQAFDSPQEYDRIAQLCSGEVSALFSRIR